MILLSAFLCRLCPGDRTTLKKEKETKDDLFKASGDAMLAETATDQICYSPNLLHPKAPLRFFTFFSTKPGRHQTLLQLSAGGFCVPNSPSPGVNTKVASADLDCWARQPAKVHSGLQKLWENLCSQFELNPAEIAKTV